MNIVWVLGIISFYPLQYCVNRLFTEFNIKYMFNLDSVMGAVIHCPP